MKKQLLSLFIAIALSISIQAQITFTQSNTSFNPGLINAVGADTAGFTMPIIGVNQQWDYSTLTPNYLSSWGYTLPMNPNFPNATYLDTNGAVALISGKYYYLNTYYNTGTNGVNALGYIINDQRYGIGNLTGNSNDSCNFPGQVCTYTTNSYLMPFPTTMNTAWHTNTRGVVNFNLSVTGQVPANTPCQKVTNSVRLDTVIGWGKMRVPTVSGHSLAYDVLMIKRVVVQTDSFYMNGTIPNPALLTFFGLTQGQATTSNRYMFWRENARYTLLMLNFGSNNFTKPSSIFYDGAAQYDTGIDEINQSSDIGISPNPNNGNFKINTSSFLNESFELNIYNIFGQIIYSKQVNSSDYSGQISVENLKSGTYLVSIVSENKKLTSKLVVK